MTLLPATRQTTSSTRHWTALSVGAGRSSAGSRGGGRTGAPGELRVRQAGWRGRFSRSLCWGQLCGTGMRRGGWRSWR
jgi:hypothetical protein